LQPLERLSLAAVNELLSRLHGIHPETSKPKVAEAAMEQPSDDDYQPEDAELLENLTRQVIDTVLGLAGRKLDAAKLTQTVEQTARKHLMTYGAGNETQQTLLTRLANETPYLINLVRLAELAAQGVEVPPSDSARNHAAPEIIGGQSPAFARVLKDLDRVAETDLPVLIMGETGTGKELLARRLHYMSSRREGSFVPLNCAAMPTSLLESELFGHAKGAFTGATSAREGFLQASQGGTLFLDEIGETTPQFQVRLLRVLEDRVVTPVGSRRGRRIDFRLITASHKDLEKAAGNGNFNQALLYRILVVPLKLPPLRLRPEDLSALIDHFLAQACVLAKRTRSLSPEARRLLLEYHWPGNVRELSHVLQRVVALAREYEIGPEILPRELRRAQSRGQSDYASLLAETNEIPHRRKAEIARILAMASDGELTNQQLREKLGCSDSTAKNYLRALVKAGILESKGRRGGRRYKVLAP
jgi:DNA-binding NtrC family response regulator